MTSLESILIIDDNEESLETLEELFKALGVPRIQTANNAEKALEILDHDQFSVILSDYWMEGMDGVAMVEALRRRGDQTPVLLVSGVPDITAILKALHQPKVAFFSKPFRINDLTSATEKLRAA